MIAGFRILLFSVVLFSGLHTSIISQEPQPPSISTQALEQQVTESSQNSWFTWISNTITTSDSLALRIILVFLLGLIMSLTPCIYPMIPITAGILQAQSSKSLITSFFLALSYTFGIATTYAILGLFAAFAGQAIGSFMNHPAFIIPLVALLLYLALAMIGLYDMYIPRFLQPRDKKVRGGSFISAFTFGAISGIVASPCLSPGLVCLLCLVTTLNSLLLGFILLFSFGIGLSVPLLIIGTFSSSLSLLPRAGMWMIEIKKLFGFLMLAMCLYFLSYIMPYHITLWLGTLFAAIVANFFLLFSKKAYNQTWKAIYTLLSMTLFALAALIGIKAIQAKRLISSHSQWQSDYTQARSHAIDQKKLLFVDIGAPFCSICKAIDKSLFADSAVQSFLESNTVPVKIDGSETANAHLMKRYKVLGFPTILLINPETEDVVKQWGPELYGKNPQSFITEVYALLTAPNKQGNID